VHDEARRLRRKLGQCVEQHVDSLVGRSGSQVEELQGFAAARAGFRADDRRLGNRVRQQAAALARESAPHVQLQVVAAREQQAIQREQGAADAAVAQRHQRAAPP